MRILIVYAHPRAGSFNEAIKDVVVGKARQSGADLRVIDLYGEAFDPVLSPEEHADYEDLSVNQARVQAQCEAIKWCDTLIFVYPTWWYGLPAILKGWLDRVLLPGQAFHLPTSDGGDIKPGLTHITRLAVFTTCGASWWLTQTIGAPGKRTILRGLRLLCAKRCKTAFAAHYSIDSSTQSSRAAHLTRVSNTLDRFLNG